MKTTSRAFASGTAPSATVWAGLSFPRRRRRSVLDVRNVAFLGTALPAEAPGPSNLALSASAFINAAGHDYELSATSPAADRGVTITEVATDRVGTSRPQGTAYDVGAYERSGRRPSPPINLRIVR